VRLRQNISPIETNNIRLKIEDMLENVFQRIESSIITEPVLRASPMMTESRAGHYRADYSKRDNETGCPGTLSN